MPLLLFLSTMLSTIMPMIAPIVTAASTGGADAAKTESENQLAVAAPVIADVITAHVAAHAPGDSSMVSAAEDFISRIFGIIPVVVAAHNSGGATAARATAIAQLATNVIPAASADLAANAAASVPANTNTKS